MNGTTLLCALIGHLVGDYILQNDWMALNKKRRIWPLTVHAGLWTIAVCVFAGWTAWPVRLALFVTHLGQDGTDVIRWWMDGIGQRAFRTGPCAPWSGIVVDNVWHVVTIYAVWRWLA